MSQHFTAEPAADAGCAQWAITCGSDDALYPVVTAGGRGERLVQQAFFGLVVVLALGWNFMWLASTSALDAAARAGGACCSVRHYSISET